jgi:hypothetical protein
LPPFQAFFFGASPSFDAVVFRAVDLTFDSILLSQAFFSNCLVVVWLLSVLVTFGILLNFWRSRGWLVDMRAALT